LSIVAILFGKSGPGIVFLQISILSAFVSTGFQLNFKSYLFETFSTLSPVGVFKTTA
jgi:hypothetical protein